MRTCKTERQIQLVCHGGFLIAAGISLLSSFGAAGDESERYRWPLDQPRVLTSSFGEYRAAGFHMGIDLRTGTVGKDVFAPAAGCVERIRCSPYGYGKAVYFRLDDGHLFVYAHLSDYSADLRASVQSEQHRAERYEVDLNPAKDRFRFERGQFLALSGQTGIGAPHLHFEVRDSAGVPIDPRNIGFDWPDATPPQINGIEVEPADSATTIDGGYLPVTLTPVANGDGVLSTRGIRASGPVRFAVAAFDSAGAAGTRLGISSAELTAEGHSKFDLSFSAIPYESYSDGVVAFHPYFRNSTRYLTLWPWPGNRVPAYARAASGTVSPSDSIAATIRVFDANGNGRSIAVPLELAAAGSGPESSQANTGEGTVRFEPVATWVVCVVQFSTAESETPTVRIIGGIAGESPMTRASAKEFQLAIEPAANSDRLQIAIEHPRVSAPPTEFSVLHGRKQASTFAHEGLRIDSTANSAFGTLIFNSTRKPPQRHAELEAVGDSFYIWHENHPIGDPIRLTIPIPVGTDLSRVHVYRQDDGWRRQDTVKNPEGLTIETRRLGLFQAFEDRHAPFLRVTSPSADYRAQTKRPILKARLSDAHSGIDGFGAAIDGKWLLVAYDPEHEELIWERDEDLPEGPRTIEFWASDHAGNVSRKAVSVTIP